jgi:hypothetical protein
MVMRINSNKSEKTELIGAVKNNDARQKFMLCTCGDSSFAGCGGLSCILHFQDCFISPGKAFALAEHIHDKNIITITTITIIIIIIVTITITTTITKITITTTITITTITIKTITITTITITTTIKNETTQLNIKVVSIMKMSNTIITILNKPSKTAESA